MKGAAVAQAMRSHDKMRRSHEDLKQVNSVSDLGLDTDDETLQKIESMAEIVSQSPRSRVRVSQVAGVDAAAFDLNGDGQIDQQEIDEVKKHAHLWRPQQAIAETKQLVEEHLQRKRGYLELLRFIAYFLLYIVILGMQSDPSSMYETQKSIQNAFYPKYSEYITKDDVISHLESKVLSYSFKDPVCGNGLCESPMEHFAYGEPNNPAHGCAADCGFFPNLTTVVVRLETHFDYENQAEVFSKSKLGWNLCLATEPLCYFKTAQHFDISTNQNISQTVQLMDGTWQIRIEGSLVLTGSAGLYVSGGVYKDEQQLSTVNCTADANNTMCAAAERTSRGSQNSSIISVRNKMSKSVATFGPCDGQYAAGMPSLVPSPVGQTVAVEVVLRLAGYSPATFAQAERDALMLALAEHIYSAPSFPQGGPTIAIVGVVDTSDNSTSDDSTSDNSTARVLTAGSDSDSGSGSAVAVAARLSSALVTAVRAYEGLEQLAVDPSPVVAAYTRRIAAGWGVVPSDFAFTSLEVGELDLPCLDDPSWGYYDSDERVSCASFEGVSTKVCRDFKQRPNFPAPGRTDGSGSSNLPEDDRKPSEACPVTCRTCPTDSTDAGAQQQNQQPPPGPAPSRKACCECLRTQEALSYYKCRDLCRDEEEAGSSIMGGICDDKLRAANQGCAGASADCDTLASDAFDTCCTPSPAPPDKKSDPSGSNHSDSNFTAGSRRLLGISTSSEDSVVAPPPSSEDSGVTAPVYDDDGTGRLTDGQIQESFSKCDDTMLGDGLCQTQCFNSEKNYDAGDCCTPSAAHVHDLKTKQADALRASVGAFTLNAYGTTISTTENVSRPLATSYLPDRTVTRHRSLGLYNNIVAGILVSQKRGRWTACDNTKFEGIYPKCRARGLDNSESTEPYGSDPVFVPTSSLYHRAGSNVELKAFKALYYNESDPAEVTSGGLPYGFRYDSPSGTYPIFLDVNLDESRAKQWVSYMRDGFFIDGLTTSVSVTALCYNGHGDNFVLVETIFDFTSAGMIKASNHLQNFRLQLYSTPIDRFRLFLELLFVLVVFYYVWKERVEMRKLGAVRYLLSVWNLVDLANLALQLFLCFSYMNFALRASRDFQPSSRFEVYHDLRADARWLRLRDDADAGLRDAHAMLSTARRIAAFSSNFVALSTVSLILMTLRLLKVLDFQPRMGLVTRTISAAAVDLFHFAILFGLVFVGFAMIAFLNFGSDVKGFSSISNAIDSLFFVIAFQDFTAYDDLRKTPNATVGTIFFYVYYLLCFFILLNILLAILVDSYAAVKDELKEKSVETMPKEVVKMLTAMTKSRGQGKLSDKELLANLTQLEGCVNSNTMMLSKKQLAEAAAQEHLAAQQTLELPNFVLDSKAIGDMLTRLRNKIGTEDDQAQAGDLLLTVLDRFGTSPLLKTVFDGAGAVTTSTEKMVKHVNSMKHTDNPMTWKKAGSSLSGEMVVKEDSNKYRGLV